MKLITYKLLNAFFLLAFVATLFTACTEKTADTPSAPTLDELINSKPELSIFAAALKKSRLEVFTQGGGPFTIFAPTNNAFIATGINSPADLNTIDSNLLVQVLTYHIQPTSRTYVEIPLGPNATMSTQGGFTQYASRFVGGAAYINGVPLASEDIRAKNGIIYLVNKILVPASANALTTLSVLAEYSLMYQAIIKTGISSNFTASPITVFALTNSAMIAAGYDATTITSLSGAGLTTLANILKYHVIPQRIFSPDFKSGNFKTSQGTNIAVVASNSSVTVKGTNNPSAIALIPLNTNVSNGVIHSTATALRP